MDFFNNQGSMIKKDSEGITNQKIPMESSDIFSIFLVSWYSQIIAKTEVKGTDAKTAPQKENLLEISEIATIRLAEIKVFIM